MFPAQLRPLAGWFVALALFGIWRRDLLLPGAWAGPRSNEGLVYRSNSWGAYSDFDIVVSYFNEPLDILRQTIHTVSSNLPSDGLKRVIVYWKGGQSRDEVAALNEMADEVVQLPNIGREGETYLTHITRHYDSARHNLAGHTIFIQPHIAWEGTFLPRLPLIEPTTGFMSFGPYLTQSGGKDSGGMEFSRMNDIYAVFRGKLSPTQEVLATWAGQFVVSRTRILESRLEVYRNLWAMFHQDKEHWIWKEGWWNNELSNPTLGHALERSWPVVFNCTDAEMSRTCGDPGPTCQCYDEYPSTAWS